MNILKKLAVIALFSISTGVFAGVITPSASVDKAFAVRRNLPAAMFPGTDILPDSLSDEAKECLKWLYAYMQTPDVTAYSPQFFQENVLSSLKARTEMPWGKSVPEREFKHFVLPVRVNNENLDMSRIVFYDELRDRVKNLSMKDAILEINHWCHEKVTYQPSDGRTSSPLSSVSQAIGRCGEESTFTVAALRAMGIPARQVYTPRWAHTDDNHAWVEAWADGNWYFLGACEPAADLNMAWFNAPASRGMLMTTNVFGPYDGPEEQLRVLPMLTTINVTSNYAPVGDVHVKVVDRNGVPVAGATVNFCIYNYADLYPAATKVSDSNGKASFTCGMGDIVAWATDGNKMGFTKVNPANAAVGSIVLDKAGDFTGSFDFDIVPPRQSGSLPVASESAEKENQRRLSLEDSIRSAYVSTFIRGTEARMESSRLGIDTIRGVKVLTEARGHGRELLEYLANLPAEKRNRALDLLCAVSEKDRRDIPLVVLHDNLENTPESGSSLWVDYVLNPRVENEWLVPYKSFFSGEINPADAERYRTNPGLLASWTAENIQLDTVGNPSALRMDPRAVWRTALADARSRAIFFVSVARSLGIPSRIDPITGKTQYYGENGEWIDVKFDSSESEMKAAATGNLALNTISENRNRNPKYYSHFALSRIDAGIPRQLEYPEGFSLNDIKDGKLPLEKGQYLLLSGQRMADGSVLAHGEIFNIRENYVTDVPFQIRRDDSALSVIGSLNAENIYVDPQTGEERSLLSSTGRGYYVIAFVKPGDEPSAHILNDMIAAKEELEKCGNKLMILFGNEDERQRFNRKAYESLPSTSMLGIDKNGVSLEELSASMNLASASRPVVAIADTFNRVVYFTQGYTIGLGDRLAELLRSL